MDIVARSLLPHGSLWVPKEFQVDETPIELITNGDFDSDLTGWTDSSEANGGTAWVATGGGRLKLTTNTLP